VLVGGRRRMSPSVLARNPEVVGQGVRESAIAALVGGRIPAPRPASIREISRRLVDDVLPFS
jgi:hypothetical protein